jgi:hypothetical protein
MNILFCANTPLAGVCELMTRCVNQYLAPEFQARCLSRGPGKHSWYKRKDKIKVPCYDVRNKDHIKECLEWANFVAFQANASLRTLGRPDLIGKMRVSHMWHGGQFWPFSRIWLPDDYPHIKFTSIGQGWNRDPWFRQFDQFGLKVVPNIISTEDEIHTPLPWKNRTKVLVAFSPSTIKATAVNRKGVQEVEHACKDTFELELIFSCTFEECMRRKRRAQLGIDEVVSPLYHRSGLEFLSQGTPCICSYDDFTASCLKEAVGSDTVPFINSSPTTLRDTIRRYMGLPDDVKEQQGKEARAWIDKYYNPRRLLERHVEIWKS